LFSGHKLFDKPYIGTVSRNFCFRLFRESSLKALKITRGSIQIFIFASHVAPQVSTTPVSTTSLSNLSHVWQIIETISGCLHLKVNLKGKKLSRDHNSYLSLFSAFVYLIAERQVEGFACISWQGVVEEVFYFKRREKSHSFYVQWRYK
jgi:hypothetical protein